MSGLTRYRVVGHKLVTGFMAPEVLDVLQILDTAQRDRNTSGAVTEIGVHHGRLFIGMSLLQRAGEKSVAVDIFESQDLNVDNSGNGDLQKFTSNVQLWSTMDDVVIHQGDSTELEPATLRDLAGGDVRLFSVDGGHTEGIVYSDMKLAEAVLADGGIVVADDVFNQHWPGVIVGTMRYLNEGAKLVPFLIGFNKVFFAQPEHCRYYREQLDQAFEGKLRMRVAPSVFAGHEVGLLVPQGAVDILRRSSTARALYHGSYRRAIKAMQLVSRQRDN